MSRAQLDVHFNLTGSLKNAIKPSRRVDGDPLTLSTEINNSSAQQLDKYHRKGSLSLSAVYRLAMIYTFWKTKPEDIIPKCQSLQEQDEGGNDTK